MTTLTPDDYLPVQWLPREEVTPNQYNPNSMQTRERELLKRSILNSGWTEPLVVHYEDLFIIDGEQRWTVAGHEDIQQNEELTPPGIPPGYVPVFGIEADGDQARVSTIQHNRARGHIEIDEMDEYAEVFEAEELVEIGLTEQELYDVIDEDPTDDADDEVPDAITEPDEVRAPEDGNGNSTVPDVPDPDDISAVCSPAERRFIKAVIPDGDTLETYVATMEAKGILEDFRTLAGE